MRVLITTDTVGGVWTFTRELTLGLLEGGHSVALVSLGRAPDADQRAWAERTVDGAWGRFSYQASDSPLEWMQSNAEAFTHSAALLERLAESFQADVIHSNQFCFGALATNVPVLITAHSDVLSWAAAANPAALAETPWLAQYKSLVQHGLYSAAGLAAPTRWMLEALEANFHLPFRRFVVGNGRTLEVAGQASLDRETWVPADPRLMNIATEVTTGISFRVSKTGHSAEGEAPSKARAKLQAVTAGRLWDEGKNVKLLMEVRSSVPLVIAGEKPEPGTTAGLEFTGQLSERALLELFAESAIYICPSLYEPFGLAPLEAALCGCAIVARHLPSLREVWGQAALYFEDAAGLERVLAELAGDLDLLAAAQQRSFARAQGFSRGRMAAGYLRCYREVLEGAEDSAHAA